MRIVRYFGKLLTVAREKTGEDTGMMTIRVSEVYRLHGMASAMSPDDSPLQGIIIRFADEPGLRGIFLVDSQGRLTGVVSRIDLLRWPHIQLFGGKGRHEISISEFFRLVDAKQAKDIARGDPRVLSVKENDTLQSALDKMLDHEEDVLPVLNNRGEIVGDMRLSEVLWFVLVKGQRKREEQE